MQMDYWNTKYRTITLVVAQTDTARLPFLPYLLLLPPAVHRLYRVLRLPSFRSRLFRTRVVARISVPIHCPCVEHLVRSLH